MTSFVFIAGTDTDCGKTLVSKLILKGLQGKGLLTFGYKPVASGAMKVSELIASSAALRGDFSQTRLAVEDDDLVNADALTLAQASSLPVPYRLINPYCFVPAIAPHVAAHQVGCEIRIADLRAHLYALQDWIQRHTTATSVTVVEGAGGWAVPLNATQKLAELALQEQMPIILVVAMKLGCINHALLSAQVIQAQGGRLVGWVANQPCAVEMTNYVDSLNYLKHQLGVPLLAEVPFIATANERDKWQLNDYALDEVAKAIGCNLNSPVTHTYATE